MHTMKQAMNVVIRVALIITVMVNALIPTVALAKPEITAPNILETPAERTLPDQPPSFYEPIVDTDSALHPSSFTDTPEPKNPLRDPIEFHITTSKEKIGDDRTITIRVDIRNNSGDEISNIRYYDTLNGEVKYISSADSSVRFNPTTGVVAFTKNNLEDGEKLSFSYSVQVNNNPEKLVINTAELEYDRNGEIIAQTTSFGHVTSSNLLNRNSLVLVPDRSGDKWASAGRYSLYLDEEVISQDVMASITSSEHRENGPALQFDIDLIKTSAPITTSEGGLQEQNINLLTPLETEFKKPAYLEINLDDYFDLKNVPAGQEAFVATYDESLDIWVKVPIVNMDSISNSVTIAAAHFSTWGVGLGSSLPKNGANVLLFDQPYTSLFTGASRYSIPIWAPPGRAGMSPAVSLSYSSATMNGLLGDVQAPWVGAGWNIDSIEIVRKITTSSNGYGYVNDFALTLNGSAYKLIQDTVTPSRYYTDHDSFLYIERHNYANGNAQWNGSFPTNDTGEWWEVVTTDGTRYRIGWNKDAEQLALMYGYKCTSNGSNCLTPDGAYASLGYAGLANNLVALRWRVDLIRDTHGNTIQYHYTESQPSGGTTIAAFDRESYVDTISYTGFEDLNEPDNNLAPSHHIRFIYGERDNIGDVPTTFNIWDNIDTKFLDEIKICHLTCDAGGFISRTYDLEYSLATAPNANGTLTLISLKISGGGYTENGQFVPSTEAPTVRFNYQNLDNRAVTGSDEKYAYPRLISIDNGAGGMLTYTYETDGRGSNSWYNYRAKDVRVTNEGTTAALQSYEYATPVYTGSGGNTSLGELIGYTTVTENQLDYTNSTPSIILSTVHTFGTQGLDIGKELKTEWASGSTVYRKTTNVYVTDNSKAPFSGWNFRYLYGTLNYELSNGNLILTTKSIYKKDPGNGNLLFHIQYLGPSVYRKTYYEYLTNITPSIYILDKVSRAILTDASNQILSDTRYHYDETINMAPSIGDITLTQKLSGQGNQTVDIATHYDQYGNVTSTDFFDQYGSVNTLPSSLPYKTEIEYDAEFYTYPIETQNALGHSSSTLYLFSQGLPYQSQDPNGWITSTGYDGLGRVLSTTAPGLDQPGVYYAYPQVNNGRISSPYKVEMQILDAASDQYRTVWGFYDGLGRMLQTQVYDEDQEQILVSDSFYNPQGLVYKQSLPYYSGSSGGYYMEPNGSHFSESFYDALGRVTSSTQPGEITTTSSYNGLTVTITDPDSRRISRTTDGLGRLVNVKEYSGDGSVYANTFYMYDIKDQLVNVLDANGNESSIQYDWLGRKLEMQDPDMGHWEYEYYPQGTLKEQTDARGAVVNFYYDALGRLLSKSGVGINTTYSYGTEPGEIGMRIGMSDTTGTTTWVYSNYGRTVTENREIGDVTQSMTTYSDWLGRPLELYYPDEEIIAYEYDSLGRPVGLTLNQNSSIVNVAYNMLGQMDSQTLGNGVLIQNGYDNFSNRLATRVASKNGVNILNFTYTYDLSGNITRIADGVLNETHVYDYDFLSRLTSAKAHINGDASEIKYHQQFDYDQVGNLVQMWDWVTSTPQAYQEPEPFIDNLASFGSGKNTSLSSFSPMLTQSAGDSVFESSKSYQTSVLTVQPNSADGIDTYIHGSSTGANYGNSTKMGIGEINTHTDNNTRGLIKFDLSGIPANATIVSATLSLWTSNDYSSNDTVINVYRLKVPFNETEANWNQSASGSNWQLPGASGTNDRESEAIGSVLISADEQLDIEKQITLDPGKLQEFVSGTFSNNGFLLKTSSELDDRFDFKTSDVASSLASQRPKLVIEYTITPSGHIFSDSFENGNLSAWNWADTDGGDLSVSTQASAFGTYGMQAAINDLAGLKAYNDSPSTEKHYSARFYLHPNSIDLPNDSQVIIFDAVQYTFCLYLGRYNNTYTLRVCGSDDVGVGFQGDVVPILNEWQAVELEWKAATSVGANNGYVKLYVNDILVSEINNLDTDTQSINDISFGVDDIPAGTSGIIYYDAFESRQGEHIGLNFTSPPQAYAITPIPTNTGMPAPTATPSFTPTATPINSTIQNWSFDTNTNNWTAGQHLSGFSWKSGGVIEGNITGVDPIMFSADNLGINIADHRFLVIRLKNLTPATQAQFFFITNTDTSWNQAKSKIFTVAPNSDYAEYIVDMSNVAGWTGTLKRLRFDPAGSTGSFGVDYISIGSYYQITPTSTIAPTNPPTATITPTVPSLVQSLKSHWDFNSPSGTTIPDVATGDSTDNSANLVNGPVIEAASVEGKSVFFDGSNDYAAITDHAEIKNNGSFTISAWVNPASDVTESTQYIVKKGAQLSEGYGLITLSSGGTPTPAGPTTVYANGNIAFQIGGLSPNMLLGPVLSTNTWTLVTGVYDANAKEMRLYLNRELVSSQSVTGTLNMGTGALQFSSSNTANVYHGRLDEVRFYNRALSANEIQGVYELHTPPAPSPTPTSTLTPAPAFTATPLPMNQQQWGTGQDGDLTVSTGETFNINTQTKQDGRTCADAVAYSVTLLGGTSARVNPSPAEGCLNPGDEVLLIQMQDSLSTTYNAGNYEFLRVEDVSGDTVIFNSQKIKWYGNGWRSDSNIGISAGQIRVMLMRVPNYDNVAVGASSTESTLTINPFDGQKYGVLAFRVSGSFTGTGNVNVNGRGYLSTTGYGAGGSGNGTQSGDGGGAGHRTVGSGEAGGAVFGEPPLQKIFLGSGGGEAAKYWVYEDCPQGQCTVWLNGAPGGAGGGIVLISGNTINYSGSIQADGGPGSASPRDKYSGGGSGGSVRIEGGTISLNTVTTNGGSASGTASGGHGRIAVYYKTSYSGNVSDAYLATLGQVAVPTSTGTPINLTPMVDWGTGRDGDLVVNGTYNLSVNGSNERSCADGIQYSVLSLSDSYATLSAAPLNSCLQAGDEILLVHTLGSGSNTGNYEFLRVGGISGNLVYFTTPKNLWYGSSSDSDSGVGSSQRVALIRVPNYKNVTINGTLTASNYGTSANGIIAFRVSDTMIGTTGNINASNLGFSSGQGYGAGGSGNGTQSGNGGGAGHRTAGSPASSGGAGGAIYGDPTLQKIFLGSSGGEAAKYWVYEDCPEGQCKVWLDGSPGGAGGGIVLISGNTINYSGSIQANGAPGSPSPRSKYSGGGSGGSVRIEGNTISLNTVTTNGGSASGTASGGHGRIAVYYYNSFSGNFTPDYTQILSLNPNSTATPTYTPTQTSTPTSEGTPTPVPSGWQTRSYAYDEDHPHAVSSLAQDSATVANYSYDQNGNMTCRTEDGVTYKQEYNTENRISSIQKLAEGTCDEVIKIAMQWDFAYDGDGVRVATLTTPYNESGLPETASLTAYYFGGAYELKDGAAIKYYAFAGQMIAMDDGTGLQYFLSDHLGSIVAVTDASGTLISQQRYLPFGGVRENVGNISQTDYGYTGQRNLDAGIGLMDYKARFYSPYLNRFIQPDSIIPDLANPQDLNRFSYVRNNPINYNDPSGHVICDDEGVCSVPPPNTGIIQEDSGSTSSGSGEICSSSICNPNGAGSPPFSPSATHKDMSLDELADSIENQGTTNFCGAYSISMARSLYYQSCSPSTGSDVADDIWWNSMFDMGVPPRANYGQYIQDNIPDAVIEHLEYATMTDLKQAVDQDKIVIVAISYETTWEIVGKILKNEDIYVGHYMVAVGYDESSVHFLNSASNKSIDTWTNDRFVNYWQRTSSFIIPSGTMFTISQP